MGHRLWPLWRQASGASVDVPDGPAGALFRGARHCCSGKWGASVAAAGRGGAARRGVICTSERRCPLHMYGSFLKPEKNLRRCMCFGLLHGGGWLQWPPHVHHPRHGLGWLRLPRLPHRGNSLAHFPPASRQLHLTHPRKLASPQPGTASPRTLLDVGGGVPRPAARHGLASNITGCWGCHDRPPGTASPRLRSPRLSNATSEPPQPLTTP